MAQGVILSNKSRDGIAALVWRNMGELEEDMWELENSTSETLETMNASAQSAMEAVNNAESALTEMDSVLESLSLSRASRLNRPNLLKQNFWTSRMMPSSAVIVEELTVPAEDATAAEQALTFTITNEAITSSYVLHGVKSSDFNVVSWDSVTGTFSAGSATITIASRSGEHSAAVTVKVALCTQSSQNVPYGNMSRIAGSGGPYLRSIYSGWYPGDDTTDNIYVSVASLAAADQITEPDGETYDKALQYNITANSAYGNTEWLQYNYANYQAGYFQGNTPRNYGHIDEMIPGKTYTVSFWARVISGDGAWMRFGWGSNYSNAPWNNDKSGVSDWQVIEGTEWRRYWWTFTFNPQGTWFTETSSEITVNNETKTYITRTYAWNKSVWFGIGRKFTSVVQLCGFRLVEGGMWLPTKYDELDESKVDKDQGSANAGKVMKVGADGKLEASSLQPDIQTAVDAVNANVAAAEEVTATAAHAVGELIMVGGALYKVTVAIAVGDTIESGTNVTPCTLAEILELYETTMAGKADATNLLSIYTGVSEYTPEMAPSFAPGVFYHQTGKDYIGMLKGSNVYKPFALDGVQIPNASDSNWKIMRFGDPDLREATIFPLPGITEYTPSGSTIYLSESAVYHEVGSRYLVMLKDSRLPSFSENGIAGASDYSIGGTGVIHLPTSSSADVDVFTIGEFLSKWRTERVSRSNPEFAGELSIQGAKLNRTKMLTLLGLMNDSSSYATPPTTIKLGSTTLSETQLQSLLAMIT